MLWVLIRIASPHNISFYEDLTKIIFEISSNTHLISSAALMRLYGCPGLSAPFLLKWAQSRFSHNVAYGKVPKFSDTKKSAVNYLKFKQRGQILGNFVKKMQME